MNPLDWAVAMVALAGQNISGDLPLFAPFEGGVLLGAIDGLGHGEEAAEAAALAQEQLKRNPALPVTELLQQCHQALRKTRGAAVSLASCQFASNLVEWAGVGNVEGVLQRGGAAGGRLAIPLRAGVVGYQMPPLRAQEVKIVSGDTLMFATDGIASHFTEAKVDGAGCQQLAERLLREYRKSTDDALVLVLRWPNSPPAALEAPAR
jgi:negative regulator of sigma-B (phosphoserine phosphatase)